MHHESFKLTLGEGQTEDCYWFTNVLLMFIKSLWHIMFDCCIPLIAWYINDQILDIHKNQLDSKKESEEKNKKNSSLVDTLQHLAQHRLVHTSMALAIKAGC